MALAEQRYPTPNSIFDRKQEVIGRAALVEQLEYNAVVAPGSPTSLACRVCAASSASSWPC